MSLGAPPAEVASAIRRPVRIELGLPISVGVARTKHLAKIGSNVAKLPLDPLVINRDPSALVCGALAHPYI
jgi:nucleotidyltransferase/DNA polymerase involved in DNA repair